MKEQVIVHGEWRADLLQEGPEQSLVKIIKGPSNLIGLSLCFPNSHIARATGSEYTEDNQELPMSEDNHTARYNELVEEAIAAGLSAKKIGTRFRNAETGAKRCEALEAAIASHKEKVAEGVVPEKGTVEVAAIPAEGEKTEPPRINQEKKMAKSATKKKPTAAAKKATKPAKSVVVAEKRNGIVGEFGTRADTNKEKLLLALYAKKNKPVPALDLIKAVYGKQDIEMLGSLKMVLQGLQVAIDSDKLPYTIEVEGRLKEATITLASKSGR